MHFIRVLKYFEFKNFDLSFVIWDEHVFQNHFDILFLLTFDWVENFGYFYFVISSVVKGFPTIQKSVEEEFLTMIKEYVENEF